MTSDQYRRIGNLDLKPLLISLGLPASSFKAADNARLQAFDTALNCPDFPDSVWLYKGGDAYRFNLRAGAIEDGPKPVTEVFPGRAKLERGAGGKPDYLVKQIAEVDLGIDAAFEMYDEGWCYTQGNSCIEVTADNDSAFITTRRELAFEFLPLQSTLFATGVDVAIRDRRPGKDSQIHFFKGPDWIASPRTSDNTVPPFGAGTTATKWGFPQPFRSKIDFAFYGTGPEELIIYFVSGSKLLTYDLRSEHVLEVTNFTDRFPALAQFVPTPQIFLVEDYSLMTYVGPITLGSEVGAPLSIPPKTKVICTIATEVSTTSTSTLQSSVLSSQDTTTTQDFYKEIQAKSERGGSAEAYSYELDASFHGDAAATGLSSYEANANLQAQGHTNDVRSNFARASSDAVKSQNNRSQKQLKTTAYTSGETYTRSERTLRTEERIIDNLSGDKPIVYRFHQEIEQYLALLILKLVRVAYLDGRGNKDVVHLSQLDDLLRRRLANDEVIKEIHKLVCGECGTIKDYEGRAVSVVRTDAGGGVAFNADLSTVYVASLSDGTSQNIEVEGVLMGVNDELVPRDSAVPAAVD